MLIQWFDVRKVDQPKIIIIFFFFFFGFRGSLRSICIHPSSFEQIQSHHVSIEQDEPLDENRSNISSLHVGCDSNDRRSEHPMFHSTEKSLCMLVSSCTMTLPLCPHLPSSDLFRSINSFKMTSLCVWETRLFDGWTPPRDGQNRRS